MNDRVMAEMVGRVFHYAENGIKNIVKTMIAASEPKSAFSLSLPWKTWLFYLAVGGAVWFLWPNGKAMPNEIWIGVLSFEGLLAALLAAVAPVTVAAGALPVMMKFFGALDAKMGEQLIDEVRHIRDDPAHTGNANAIRNAFIMALNTLVVLPLPVVLSARWLATILFVSLCWTIRRIIPDAVVFVLTEYAPILPAAYWQARSWHEQLSYCPVCQGEPHTASWPPPRTSEKRLGLPQESSHPEGTH